MEARDMTVQAIGPMEVAQIAGEAGFIGGVAGVMVGITLVVSSVLCSGENACCEMLHCRI